MKMIQLNTYMTNQTFYINPAVITGYEVKQKATRVFFSQPFGDDEATCKDVVETPQQIEAKLKKAR